MKEKEMISILRSKSLIKQDVYEKTFESYKLLRSSIEKKLENLRVEIPEERVRLKYDYNGDFETHAYVGSDVIIFNMHTNVFTFPKNHAIWSNSYIEEDLDRAYFGVINMYNFLADSFLHNRMNDAGYLIGRIFINKKGDFMIEGKGELSYYFKNIRNNKFDKNSIDEVLNIAIKHVAEFDLHTPPYQKVSHVNVQQIKRVSNAQELKTGKRLGFKFKTELNKNN